MCATALSTSSDPSLLSKIYVNLMGVDFPREDAKNIFYLGYTISGEAFEIEGEKWDADLGDYELGKRFMSLGEKLVGAGAVKNHPVKMLEGGLEGIQGGMEDLKNKRVSGVKLVARVGDP